MNRLGGITARLWEARIGALQKMYNMVAPLKSYKPYTRSVYNIAGDNGKVSVEGDALNLREGITYAAYYVQCGKKSAQVPFTSRTALENEVLLFDHNICREA